MRLLSLISANLLASVFFISCQSPTRESKETEEMYLTPQSMRIAFGSCSRQDKEQVLWPEVLNQQPNLWIWGGDNIYGDTHDMDLMAEKYALQKSHPHYQKMISSFPIIGIWDDHDYGINDGGKHYPMREESKVLMLEFLDVPKDHPAWSREGGYQSYTFGAADSLVKVILLDTRYFRDTLYRTETRPYAYLPNLEGDILGEAQWQWLEEELTDSPAKFHVIMTTIQLLSEEHRFEKWANYPKAHQRMFDLLKKTQPKNAFFLSGDRHISEVSRKQVTGLPYPLYDITSSGLTHTWGEKREEPNQYRQGELVIELSYGLLDLDFGKEEVIVQLKGESDTTFVRHVIRF